MATNIDGGTGIDKIQDAVVTDDKLSLSPNSQPIKDALNAGGAAPIYACRAWVNFNGTGTVAIRASGNVSSITDNGTGDYTMNFATAMPDADYAVQGLCGQGPGGPVYVQTPNHSTELTQTTTQFRFGTATAHATGIPSTSNDAARIFVSILR